METLVTHVGIPLSSATSKNTYIWNSLPHVVGYIKSVVGILKPTLFYEEFVILKCGRNVMFLLSFKHILHIMGHFKLWYMSSYSLIYIAIHFPYLLGYGEFWLQLCMYSWHGSRVQDKCISSITISMERHVIHIYGCWGLHN